MCFKKFWKILSLFLKEFKTPDFSVWDFLTFTSYNAKRKGWWCKTISKLGAQLLRSIKIQLSLYFLDTFLNINIMYYLQEEKRQKSQIGFSGLLVRYSLITVLYIPFSFKNSGKDCLLQVQWTTAHENLEEVVLKVA